MNNLEIRLCALKQIISGGEPQSFGLIGSHASSDAIAHSIVALQFDGSRISSDTTDLQNKVRVAQGAGFPANDVLVIAAAGGASEQDRVLAADRGMSVKELLVGLGVPAAHIVVDMPKPFGGTQSFEMK